MKTGVCVCVFVLICPQVNTGVVQQSDPQEVMESVKAASLFLRGTSAVSLDER